MWWMWTKRIFFIVASVFLLFGAFRRIYYFHDEIVYGDPKLLNPSYASQIQVETYLMTLQNLINLFEGKPPNPEMRDLIKDEEFSKLSEPSTPRFYLVIRLKNEGNEVAWGRLECFTEGRLGHRVDVPSLAPHMDKHKIIALIASQVDKNQFGKDKSYPQVKSHWSQLYTEKEKNYE